MVERIKNKRGFTIIEIMVVIALIGILAAVLVPKFGGIKDTARDTGMLTNVKMVEAYVASVIDQFTVASAVDDDTPGTEGDLLETIENKFSGDNALTNPYTGLQTNTNIVVTTGTNFSGGDTGTTPDDDGVVYVVVNASEPLTVYINGFDKDGNEMKNTEREIVR